jgi:hypothetical protein
MKNIVINETVVQLRKICGIIANVKAQQIPKLPHYGHESIFFQNSGITTGLINNNKEIKIDLFNGLLLYYDNEYTQTIDLTDRNIYLNFRQLFSHSLEMLQIDNLEILKLEDLKDYFDFISKANLSLEVFRSKLNGNFTLVHLWPDGFDLSVEWFTGIKDQQIGIGISPGDKDFSNPYLYVNPYPFNRESLKEKLPIGIWNTFKWNGIKVEWYDLEKLYVKDISNIINDLFNSAKKLFNVY